MKMYKEAFKATNKGEDITYVNFNHLGLYKKEFFDNKGDLIKNEFYTDYDQQNDIFSGLAIKEERTYARHNATGLPILRMTDITWYGISGDVIEQRTGLAKTYTFQKGFRANKRARRNLLEQASLFFYMELLTNNAGDTVLSDAQKNEFDEFSDKAQDLYIRSNINPLIDAINNAADIQHSDYKTYMTAAMAATMVSILDVNYDG